ncbi:MAG: glutamine--fructose-6-phosphate transaminase (isomerizing) [Deltaproteobacteria bacterium]|jgi:glucosamine--fructose-6-phosphate aminotransferase (isomerizing)|nr:glutamine--fructose-6-phosphate transaminase (isomerizing) [Deltaproteobacteria bacterium]
MCGIIGILAKNDNIVPRIMEGLKLLEYRGYDSTGLAVLNGDGSLARRRATGKIAALAQKLAEDPVSGKVGIGHTRWATHGPATESNAHPLATDRVAVVHNGIIENYQDIKNELVAMGHAFESQTDSEVAARLMHQKLGEGLSPQEATMAVLARLEGAFSLVYLFADRPNLLIGVRRGSPLAVGFGEDALCLGSDAIALGPHCSKIVYLEDDDWAELNPRGAIIRTGSGQEVSRPSKAIDPSFQLSVGKGGYRHFMLKEMHEQPQVVGDTLSTFLGGDGGRLELPELPFDLAKASRLNVVACGTSHYASMVGKYWIERLAHIPVDVDVASEFRYRNPVLDPAGVSVFISQSGETADTLAALRHCRAMGQKTLSVVNVMASSLAREADASFLTMAGPEFGVASTKAFTAQLTLLAALAIHLGAGRGLLDRHEENRLTRLLLEAPAHMAEILAKNDSIETIAKSILAPARDVLYLGRGHNYPLAMEGALKLKELSYIHAEGYPSGEIKHGPIALIDERVPVVFVAPTDHLFPKILSNLEEVKTRGGQIVFIGDGRGYERLNHEPAGSVIVSQVDPFVAPLIYALPVQLLAYHAAVFKGTDVDQPRNLAKSVTVE